MNKETCLKSLKAVLQSTDKAKSIDNHGNVVYLDVDVYSDEMLNTFLDMSLSDFNQTPYFTFYSYQDEKFVKIFMASLVKGAVLYALSSQALLERGREFTIVNGGINFDPPNLSEFLMTQYRILLEHHFQELKNIKNSIHDFKL